MYHTAMSLGITGWVRNCFDGSVQAELQGDREAIDECIGRVAAGNFVEITDIKSEKIPVIEDDRRFSIRD
jgi:acylphosphatase